MHDSEQNGRLLSTEPFALTEQEHSSPFLNYATHWIFVSCDDAADEDVQLSLLCVIMSLPLFKWTHSARVGQEHSCL